MSLSARFYSLVFHHYIIASSHAVTYIYVLVTSRKVMSFCSFVLLGCLAEALGIISKLNDAKQDEVISSLCQPPPP